MHGIDHGFSRSNFEIAVSQEWEGWLTLEKKGYQSVIYGHERDLLVTKVRCNDLLDSDRGDLLACCRLIYFFFNWDFVIVVRS